MKTILKHTAIAAAIATIVSGCTAKQQTEYIIGLTQQLSVPYVPNTTEDGGVCIDASIQMVEDYLLPRGHLNGMYFTRDDLHKKHKDFAKAHTLDELSIWVPKVLSRYSAYADAHGVLNHAIYNSLYSMTSPFIGDQDEKSKCMPVISAVKGVKPEEASTEKEFSHAVVVTGMYFTAGDQQAKSVWVRNPLVEILVPGTPKYHTQIPQMQWYSWATDTVRNQPNSSYAFLHTETIRAAGITNIWQYAPTGKTANLSK